VKVSAQDAAAAFVSIIVALALIVHAFKEVTLPPELNLLIGASVTWLFIRTTQAAESRNGSKKD